jgi:Zn ribbon nucleic-acid-binding protein
MRSLDDERARCAALLPAGAACEACGEDDSLVLNSDDRMILCAECDAIRNGRSQNEKHHVAGRRYSAVTLLVPANLHRRLTAMQRVRARNRQWHGKDEARKAA